MQTSIEQTIITDLLSYLYHTAEDIKCTYHQMKTREGTLQDDISEQNKI